MLGKDRNISKYKHLAESVNVSGRVIFLGPRKDMVRFLQASDAFILPTIYDPFSHATLEALAMGLYTITSDANGCAEIIQEGAGKIIRDLSGKDEIVAAMKSALSPYDRKKIRESVRDFNFTKKLNELINICVNLKQ